MPTRTTNKPFAAGPPPDRDTLLAYAEGRLDAAQQHAVEQHLEADPLLREAMEGLSLPGAGAGIGALNTIRPRNGGWGPWATAGALVLVAGAWLVLSPLLERKDVSITSGEATAATEQMAIPPTEAEIISGLDAADIAAAEEVPETLRIGHLHGDRHTEVAATVVRDPVPDRLRGSDIRPAPDAPNATPAKAPRPITRLIYVQGFKLAHPDDLHPTGPNDEEVTGNVLARYADRAAQHSGEVPRRMRGYVPFMDEALARFRRNDHKSTLEELRFLLDQYPDDVNALFYGGLCAYNLGLYGHARTLLHRAATHAMPVFDEEATWYHALTLERLGEHTAAQEAFARIAARGGFYGAQAKDRLD